MLRTRDGLEIPIEWSNQVWQCDHTKIDVLVVDQAGTLLGRPWLTIVVDTYSRCIMGIHLGFDAPSAAVVCLGLRHAILPKQYSSAYELQESWGTYGLPQHLYTDGGKDFRSQHIEQVAIELELCCTCGANRQREALWNDRLAHSTPNSSPAYRAMSAVTS